MKPLHKSILLLHKAQTPSSVDKFNNTIYLYHKGQELRAIVSGRGVASLDEYSVDINWSDLCCLYVSTVPYRYMSGMNQDDIQFLLNGLTPKCQQILNQTKQLSHVSTN